MFRFNKIIKAIKRSIIGNPNISYYHIQDYQVDMIVRDKIYVINIVNILSFFYPGDRKEKEIIKHLEDLYRKKVVMLKQPKRYSISDLLNILKNLKIKTQ